MEVHKSSQEKAACYFERAFKCQMASVIVYRHVNSHVNKMLQICIHYLYSPKASSPKKVRFYIPWSLPLSSLNCSIFIQTNSLKLPNFWNSGLTKEINSVYFWQVASNIWSVLASAVQIFCSQSSLLFLHIHRVELKEKEMKDVILHEQH